jgi:hypothetical protein
MKYLEVMKISPDALKSRFSSRKMKKYSKKILKHSNQSVNMFSKLTKYTIHNT